MEEKLTLKQQMELVNFDYKKPLYHGTNKDFDGAKIKASSSKGKDHANELWDGFYVTQDENQAIRYAVDRYLSEDEDLPNDESSKIILKKFVLDKEWLAKEISLALYNESNERTVDFIRQNIKKETLADCISKEKDCYNCNLECPRNSEFVYGVLCDGVIDDVLVGIKQGLSNEELNAIIWEELGLKRGYQLAVRASALGSLTEISSEPLSEDDPKVKKIIEEYIKNGKYTK